MESFRICKLLKESQSTEHTVGSKRVLNMQVLAVDVEAMTPQSSRAELKPVPFGSYRSPLLVFRSYR